MGQNVLRWSGLIFLIASTAFGEGATTVGDGGHVVICDSASGAPVVQLLDLFEAEVRGHETQILLGSPRMALLDKVRIGLDRIKPGLQLSDAEIKQLMFAAERFVHFPYDPWLRAKNGGSVYIIKAQDPMVSPQVYSAFVRKKCRLDTVVIHPDHENRQQRRIYENICMAGINGIKNCFLTNTRYLKVMNSDEKACLVLHETLRFLSKEKRFRRDSDLRSMTVFACTGHKPNTPNIF